MKTTHEDLIAFSQAAQAWLDKDKANANTKLGYAIAKLHTRMKKILDRYNNAREDIQIDTCSPDEKGIILRDERGNYRYTKEGMKERNKQLQALYETPCEIEPYIATALPDDLTEIERDQFAGFVIRVEMEATRAAAE
jgi:hypothetical protein